MARKYKQDRQDREDESRGMRRYEDRRHRDERADRSYDRFVTGHDPHIGRDDFAGLPEDKIMKKYPPFPHRRGGYLDDTIEEIDAIQRDTDHRSEVDLSYQH